jgi:NHLM bacteriocin system ABC transporter ATP-binding protein
MGWFDEQIRQRKQNDQEIYEDSIFHMASSIMGKAERTAFNDHRYVTKAAIDEILRYYHYKPTEIPDKVVDKEEQLDFSLRPFGIMRRPIELDEGWYKDAFGPILAIRKDDGSAVALIPLSSNGYKFRAPGTGKFVKVDRSSAKLFEKEAICFYRPLPQKKLGIPDLILYLKNCLSASDYFMIVLLTLGVILIDMLMPYITKVLTGYVVDKTDYALLWGTSIFMVTAIISSIMIKAVKNLGMSRLEIKTSLSIEAAVMSRLMNLPPRFFRDYSSGELSIRARSVSQLCQLILGDIFSMGLTSLMSLLYIAQVFQFAPALVAPAIIIIVLTVAIGIAASFMQIRISKQILEHEAKDKGLSFSIITGVQKIKLAGAEKRAFAKWANAYSHVAQLVYDPPTFIKLSTVFTSAVSLIGTIVLFFLAVKTKVSPSEYIAFNSAFGMVMGAFTSLAGVALTAAKIRPILEMAEPILKNEPESSENKTMVTEISGAIELSNVCFRYNDTMPYVIEGMDLKIKSGEYVAIVGPSGCGKSTLMRLLLGFEKPEKGAVYYDGRDISSLDLRSLRQRIGSVTQNGTLFQGDIYSNIVISAPHLTLDDAWKAAELAGIADDIREMPMGMNTVIAEGQGGISGGQKQRIMIARAIAPSPKVLMFDEATSALDNKTQKKISDALDELNCTRIVIAHRLSTIRHCDRILVMDKGRIVEQGTYDELIKLNGKFAELVERQRLDTDSK